MIKESSDSTRLVVGEGGLLYLEGTIQGQAPSPFPSAHKFKHKLKDKREGEPWQAVDEL